jgi:hypothetical protein
VVSRDELTAAQREELDALDRILAREAVDERHLELAALVDSVRAGAPRMDPAFAARMDARLAGRGRRGPLLDGLRARRLALASGGLVAAAVAFTIVISSGVFNGAGTQRPHVNNALSSGHALTPAAGPPSVPGRSTGAQAGVSAGGSASGATGAAAGSGASGGSTAVAVSPSTPASGPSGGRAVLLPEPLPVTSFSGALARGARLVHRDSTLTLASSPSTMQGVANQIVAATEHAGGIVESSNVDIQGAASLATFNLQVPSGRLESLVTTLSSLASVRALNQGTQDITDGYDQEQARLADHLAEHAALLKQLAVAATAAQAASIQKQLTRLASLIAAEHRQIDRLLSAGRTASLYVSVVPGAAAKHAAAGPFATAFHRGLHALEEILAIALVAFAIVLPFALTALALWWAGTMVRQRARERAMRTA